MLRLDDGESIADSGVWRMRLIDATLILLARQAGNLNSFMAQKGRVALLPGRAKWFGECEPYAAQEEITA